MSETSMHDLDRLREDLAGHAGPTYWKRLEAWGESAEFRSFVEREYPSQLGRITDPVARRDFLRLMGASLAVAGLGACTRQPEEKILPYARTPESTVPGRPRFFATAMPLDGAALGLLVESHMGRPTKCEGNPEHPASLGATDSFAQAATLGLYDPDRSQSVLRAGQISTWDAFLADVGARLERLEAQQGEGLRFLVAQHSSPTLEAQLEAVRVRFPRARVHRWTPLHRDQARLGAELAFGRDALPLYAFDRAAVVVSVDADFLVSGPGGVRHARDFAARRRVRQGAGSMSRFYAIESGLTLTGSNADERLGARPSELEGIVRGLARAVGVEVAAPALNGTQRSFVERVAARLQENRGAGLLLAGEGAAASVHALVHAINDRLGNAGKTVEYVAPWQDSEPATASLRALLDDARRGDVRMLFMLGGNPVYDAPADLDCAAALDSVAVRVHLSAHEDETSRRSHWHLPETHFLESWSDARAWDGTVSIVQPLIAPLYDGISVHELLASLAGAPQSAYDAVRGHWRGVQSALSDADFERFWDGALHDGQLPGTRAEALALSTRRIDFGPAPAVGTGLEIVFRRDASVHDGRFANNGWLQELPRPLTRLTWDNAAIVSSATAAALGKKDGQTVVFTHDGRSVEAPVWILAGQPDDVVTMHLGYGRTVAGRLGSGRGFDAYRLRRADRQWWTDQVTTRSGGGSVLLASVQDHGRMEGRDIVRVAEFDRFKRDPKGAFGHHHEVDGLSLYPEHPYEGDQWGMVIDLTACVGCNACTIACQSENNVPIVGKEEVAKGRELHWIRIDRYFEADEDGREHVHHQPVPCMHCEQAPCEVVCPVGATVHGDEGLNEMVYNRCVGTRYCSNNCPYKVRRFNFFHYSDYDTESLKLGNNPDVTIRSRGVMEKCTYCVQRINQTRIEAKKEGRAIRDGEVQTACQQVCPTQAIVFGNINDPSSAVSALRKEPQHYGLLAELGTRPRTTYLAKLENPDPSGSSDSSGPGDAH